MLSDYCWGELTYLRFLEIFHLHIEPILLYSQQLFLSQALLLFYIPQ